MAGSSNQSTFVTVVAWLVLILSAMSTLAGLMQSVMLAMVDPFPPVTAEEAKTLPLLVVLAFNNFRVFAWGMTAAYAVTCAAAVGVLRRQEWGRQVLMVMFSIAAVGSAAIAIGMQLMMNEMFQGVDDPPPDARAMIVAMRAFGAVFAIVFVAAFGWLAYKFSTPAVRAEFT